MRQWHDVLAAVARLAGDRGLGPTPSGAAKSAGPSRPDRLGAGLSGLGARSRKKGGATGPEPTNRGKPGTKHYVVSDRRLGAIVRALHTVVAQIQETLRASPVQNADETGWRENVVPALNALEYRGRRIQLVTEIRVISME